MARLLHTLAHPSSSSPTLALALCSSHITRNDHSSASVCCDSVRRSSPAFCRRASIASSIASTTCQGARGGGGGGGGGWPHGSPSSSALALLLPRASSGGGSSSSPRETVDISLDFGEEEEEVGANVVAAPPPTFGRIDIVVDKDAIRKLDLSAAHAVLRKFVHQVGDSATAPPSDAKELLERTVGFVIKYEADDPFDPRELSEMPDIRLWFVRLDATYPWLPIVLDWRAGELARYAALLVPHQMSKRSGLVFNPEALELFAMKKVFLLHSWLKVIGIPKPENRLNDMLKMLGFSVTDELYNLIELHPPP